MNVLPAGTVRQELATGGPAAMLALARTSRGPVVEGTGLADYEVTFVFAVRPAAPQRVGLFCPALPGGYTLMRDLGDGVFAATARFPQRTRVAYHFCLDPPGGLDGAGLAALSRSAAGRRIDPLNPLFDQLRLRGLRLRLVDSLLVLPGAPAAPAVRPRPGVPAGWLEQVTIDSRELGRRKDVLVYCPPGGPAGRPLVLLLQGNEEWQSQAFLDNLVAGGRVPPFTAVLLSERSITARLRDFTSGPAHSRFVTRELWPALAGRGLPAGPAATVAGYSAGGLAAVALAADEPAMFPRLAVISGALHLSPGQLNRIGEQPGVPGRAYLAAGWYEDAWEPAILAASAQLAGLLRERGSDVRFDSGPHGHDTVSARACLAEGLSWLLRSP